MATGAAEIGSAYLKVIPKMSNNAGAALSTQMAPVGGKGAEGFSSGFMSGIGGLRGMVAAFLGSEIVAGIYKFTKASLDAYADYEQLAGGIETLYGDAYEQVMQNAETAYMRAGMSANEYMDTAVQSAAVLEQNLGGDVVAAAGYADKAILQMSDNANKFGSDMQSIQDAYRGFSRGQFQLLDNLNLGYSGTREEMERLLADAEAISGVHYDINNYADIIDAIGVIQDQMGVTGTTAEEAAQTISGSLGMLKGAWSNWLAGLMNPDADVEALTGQLIESLGIVISNIAPAVGRMFLSIGGLIVNGIKDGLIAAFPGLEPLLNDYWARTAESWQAFTEGISQVWNNFLKPIFEAIGNAIRNFADAVLPHVQAAWERIQPSVQMLTDAMSRLWNEVLVPFGDWIVATFCPNIEGSGTTLGEVVGTVLEGLITGIGLLFQGIAIAVNGIIDFFSNLSTNISTKCNEIKAWWDGLVSSAKTKWEAIKSAITTPIERARDTVKRVIDKIKSYFNFSWSLPKLKLPHIEITGEWGFNPPSYPHFSINWYKTGGVFGSPSVIGVGDAPTPEIVTPQALMADTFASTLNAAGIREEIAALRQDVRGMKLYLDGTTLVGGIADRMDTALGQRNLNAARGF